VLGGTAGGDVQLVALGLVRNEMLERMGLIIGAVLGFIYQLNPSLFSLKSWGRKEAPPGDRNSPIQNRHTP
jgi:hypothetical protein